MAENVTTPAQLSTPIAPQMDRRRSFGLSNVLVTAGIIGCIFAVCVRIQMIEDRLRALEAKDAAEFPSPSGAERLFRPVVARAQSRSSPSSTQQGTRMPPYTEGDEVDELGAVEAPTDAEAERAYTPLEDKHESLEEEVGEGEEESPP